MVGVRSGESVNISISLPKDLLEKLDKLVELEHSDRSEIIRRLLLKHLAVKGLLSEEEAKILLA
jgi:metal-responsive CopG/Arc/MetJ family transcriptional regulator